MLKTVSFILALSVASAGIAQQASPRPSSTGATGTSAKKQSPTKNKAGKRRPAATATSTPPTSTGTATGRNDPAGTVPTGAPGTTDPTIPGSPPQS